MKRGSEVSTSSRSPRSTGRFDELSHRLAAEATDEAARQEIVGVTVKARKGEPRSRPRGDPPDTTLETMAKLRRSRGGRTHTAATPGLRRRRAVVVVSRSGRRKGRTPLARSFLRNRRPTTSSTGENDGKRRQQALEKIGKGPADVDRWEINEALLGAIKSGGCRRRRGQRQRTAARWRRSPDRAWGPRIVGPSARAGRRGGGHRCAAICSEEARVSNRIEGTGA